MPMRRALLNRGLSAEEYGESPPKADEASFGAAALFYAARATDATPTTSCRMKGVILRMTVCVDQREGRDANDVKGGAGQRGGESCEKSTKPTLNRL